VLEQVLESTPQAVVLCNEADRVIFANLTARALFFNGKKMEGLVLAEVLAKNPGEVREALKGEGDFLFTVERGGELETFGAARRDFPPSTQPHTPCLGE